MSKTENLEHKYRTRANKKGVAIKGYDPVAYFTIGEPTKGSSDITYQWDDAEWWFSTEAHRDEFAADPLAYVPQFGGNCAVAAATGHRVKASPKRWRIEKDGRLYLNKDRFAALLHGPLSSRILRLSEQVRGASRAGTEQRAAAGQG
jgi:YHS domain-containing protein